jgi:hypothetical protein
MTDLFHYTCRHGQTAIGIHGWLLCMDEHAPEAAVVMRKANPDLAFLTRLIWLTTQAEPEAEALGLTKTYIACDRTAFRYRVTALGTCAPWTEAVRSLKRVWPSALDLAFADGARPAEWWVSTRPVPVMFDPL